VIPFYAAGIENAYGENKMRRFVSTTSQEKSGFQMKPIEMRLPWPEYARRWCTALSFVLFSSLVYGQTAPANQQANPPAQEPAEGTPHFTTNVDEVSLDLVVHDKKHKPVLDLKPEDIAITDDGTPVKLSAFRLVRGETGSGHVITLVFDRFEGPLAKSARIMAEKILKALPTTGYSFSVLDIGGRLRLLQGYTEDRASIEQAITFATDSNVTRMVSTLSQGVNIAQDKAEPERVTAAEAAEKNLVAIARTGVDTSGRHVDVKQRAKAQTTLKALEDAQLIVQDQHANRSLAAILALVRSQQQLAERKAIIYFTLNETLDSGSKEMLKTISGAATKAGVTIYTVDLDSMNIAGQRSMENALANGQAQYNPTPIVVNAYGQTAVQSQQEGGAPIAGTPSATGPQWGPAQDIAQATSFSRGNNEDPNRAQEIKNPIADLSKDTGGVYIDAQVSVKGPLQQMVEDLSTYYEASYIPPAQEYDGKFRSIDVKPLRVGLKIQAKTGYFSLPPGSASGIRPFEASLLKSLAETQLPADFKFNASILRFGNLPDGNMNALAVEVPFSGLDIKEDTHTNLYSTRVAIVAQIKDSAGTIIEHFGEDIARRGALESMDRDKNLAVTLQRHFMEIPGKYVLEVAVKDENNEKISAQRIPFEIPAQPSGPAMSDLVLVRKMDTFNEDADPLEPLHYEGGKVIPNLSGTVPHESKSLSLFLILHPDPHATDAPTLEMQVIRNGKAGRLTPLPLRTAGAKDTMIPYLATFQTKSLAPGDYKVKAIMNQGGDSAFQEIAFTVEGNQPGENAVADASGKAGATAAPDESTPNLDITPDLGGKLAITASTNSVPAPTREEADALIADARERAVGYKTGLPNFLCIEVINRSLDPTGTGRWRHRDTITELLRYREQNETRTVLEVDGKPAASADPEAIKGPKSTGEFGAVLGAVFEPSAKADFKWKETDTLGNGTVQVFDYNVAKANSAFSVGGPNGLQPNVNFHGKVYIDSATHSVRRVTLIADDLPKDFPTRATTIIVDYDYVSINAHDYLMPISAEVSLLEGRHEALLNTIEFRDYRRFGSNVKILNFRPMATP
jgi:VWFA-related protein